MQTKGVTIGLHASFRVELYIRGKNAIVTWGKDAKKNPGIFKF